MLILRRCLHLVGPRAGKRSHPLLPMNLELLISFESQALNLPGIVMIAALLALNPPTVSCF